MRLLAPLVLADQPRFCLVLKALALCLIIYLNISRVESIGSNVIVSFSR